MKSQSPLGEAQIYVKLFQQMKVYVIALYAFHVFVQFQRTGF